METVLILVVMEDALVRLQTNPKRFHLKKVLILVVMEDALVHDWRGSFRETFKVLILVVMEDALVLYLVKQRKDILVRLNPCCNGRCTRTYGFRQGEKTGLPS